MSTSKESAIILPLCSLRSTRSHDRSISSKQHQRGSEMINRAIMYLGITTSQRTQSTSVHKMCVAINIDCAVPSCVYL